MSLNIFWVVGSPTELNVTSVQPAGAPDDEPPHAASEVPATPAAARPSPDRSSRRRVSNEPEVMSVSLGKRVDRRAAGALYTDVLRGAESCGLSGLGCCIR